MNLFIPMLLVGIVTSVHCVTMCGTMVLSYAVKGDNGGPFLKRMAPHFAYHTAKIISYMLVGLLLGAIGAAFDLGGVRGWVTVFAGAFMILMGLNMIGRFPWLRWVTLRPPKFLTKAIVRLRRRASADEAAGESSLLTPVMFGSLTGLMPCGPLQSAQIAAAGAGSAAAGSIAMLGFGLGTMPLMLGFGAVSGMLGHKFRERMMTVAALVIVGVGLVMLNRGAMLVGSPVTFETAKTYVLGGAPARPSGSQQQLATGKDGVAEVNLTIRNTQYVPNVVRIPAGRPVRLVIDRQEDNACSAQAAIPQLGILQNLKAFGTTVVDIPATKAGSYTLTCGMGMMSGRLDVGGGATPAPSRLPLLAVLLAAAGAGTWAYAHRRSEHAASAKRSGGAPEPSSAPGFLGFTPEEVVLASAGLAVAVLLGLYLGGFLS